MSRHGLYAPDSAKISLIIPKWIKEWIGEKQGTHIGETASDIARSCLVIGILKYKDDERKKNKRLLASRCDNAHTA